MWFHLSAKLHGNIELDNHSSIKHLIGHVMDIHIPIEISGRIYCSLEMAFNTMKQFRDE